MGITVVRKYDRILCGVYEDILEPSKENIADEKLPIVITISRYVDGVARELRIYGKIEGIDFFTFEAIIDHIIHTIGIDVEGEVWD